MTAASQLSPVIRIVDDDDRVRESVAFVLQIDGHQTEEYESAEDFLKFSDFERPGCIVLDIRMPGMSGLELQLELKNRGSTIPISHRTRRHGCSSNGTLNVVQRILSPNRLNPKFCNQA